MHRVYLGLGSSVGDRLGHLRAALRSLHNGDKDTRLLAISPIYESPHLGLKPEDTERYPPHLNCVAHLETRNDPETLLDFIQSVEALGGRQRLERWGPRTIDIDILLYADREIQTERLRIPHPALTERAFALVPLHDIAPNLRLPDGRAVSNLIALPSIRSQHLERVPFDELFL